MKQFQLPKNISMNREWLKGSMVYIFRDKKLGEIGRIVVQGLENGETNLACEVTGDKNDPMTQKRLKIFEPVSEGIINMMTSIVGEGEYQGEIPKTPRNHEETVATKLMDCNNCGENVALLIFTEEDGSQGAFEDLARKTHHLYTKLDVPTWIIGPAIGELKEDRTDTPIMKVWPIRKKIKITTAVKFNKKLDKLIENHC
jgi:hypothetical protein